MNKLGSVDLDQFDFEDPVPDDLLAHINDLGRLLREAKSDREKDTRRARVALKNDLPEGFLQAAMYTMSYQTALAMLLQRENHRLPQWRLTDEGSICQFLMSLPYMPQFYEAATFKRTQLRDAITKLTEIIGGPTDEGGKFLTVGVKELTEICNKLRRAA